MARRASILLALAVLLPLWALPALAGDGAADAARKALDCGAPQSTVARVLADVVGGALDNEDGRLLLEPLEQACAERLPVAPLAEKIDEGLAKAKPAAAIRRVLDRRLDDLRFSNAVLGNGREPRGEALEALAGSLEAGLSRQDLQGLADRHPKAEGGMLGTAALVWAYLAQAGVPAAEAAAVADAGLDLGTMGPEWLQFPRLAARALQDGRDGESVREAALAALGSGGDLRVAASRLGLTARDLGGRDRSAPGI